jgi:hypothetical protein
MPDVVNFQIKTSGYVDKLTLIVGGRSRIAPSGG